MGFWISLGFGLNSTCLNSTGFKFNSVGKREPFDVLFMFKGREIQCVC